VWRGTQFIPRDPSGHALLTLEAPTTVQPWEKAWHGGYSGGPSRGAFARNLSLGPMSIAAVKIGDVIHGVVERNMNSPMDPRAQ